MEAAQMVAKSRRKTVAKSSSKIKTAVVLSPEAFRRLGIASVMEGRSQSELIESLIVGGLAQYVVSVRGGRAAEPACEDRQSGEAA